MSKIECWKSAFSASSPDYEPVYVSPRRKQAAGRHFVQGQCCGVSGLVERYDIYAPKNMIVAEGQEVVVAVIRLGRNLSGYPGLLHGGVAALLFDDVTGSATDVVLNRERHHPQAHDVAHDVPPDAVDNGAVTANLEVDFLFSAPTESTVLIQVRLASPRRGRKIDLEAQLTDLDQMVVYAHSHVLYVIPRSSL